MELVHLLALHLHMRYRHEQARLSQLLLPGLPDGGATWPSRHQHCLLLLHPLLPQVSGGSFVWGGGGIQGLGGPKIGPPRFKKKLFG